MPPMPVAADYGQFRRPLPPDMFFEYFVKPFGSGIIERSNKDFPDIIWFIPPSLMVLYAMQQKT